jgi:hypothetical protein
VIERRFEVAVGAGAHVQRREGLDESLVAVLAAAGVLDPARCGYCDRFLRSSIVIGASLVPGIW